MKYGRYEVVKELGKGSMGMVYQAHDPQIDRLVALKVLRQDRLTSEAFVQRFLKEAKTIGRLSHPNIVTVYDVGQDQGTIYIAMEFLEGEPLDKTIEGRRIVVGEMVGLGIQVAGALHYAHQKGVVHRDVKPSNIILQSDGRIKITDFGIAHIEDPSASVQTQDGEILGTPASMSPEQALGRPVDGRSDLFSLGVILYELAAGQRPFRGESLAAIFRAVTQEDPGPPEELNPSIPSSLSKIIMECLAKEPESRFETGEDLACALGTILDEGESVAEKPLVIPPKPKISPLAILVILVLVVAAGVLSYYFLRPKSSSPPVAPPKAVEIVKNAALKVESSPEGAELFIDGNFKAKTPARLELPAGKHEVRLVLKDYYDWEAQVQLKEEGELPLSVQLAPMREKKP